MRSRGSRVRRAALRAAVLTLTAVAVIGQAAGASAEDRTLSLYEIHTKETLTVTYKRDGVWDEEALKKLNWFMRDWRVNEPTTMNRELIDLVWTLHQRLGSKEPIHLVSAYRSPRTNEKLRRSGGGQARRSQHTLGRACDIHFPDIPVKTLRASALIQEVGGVGYYPTSGIPFVHVDVGNVRMWPRMPRLELAALFPEGKTGYIPSDGRRITKRDYQTALAKGMVNPTLIAQARGLASPTAIASATPLPTPNPVRLVAQLTNPPVAMPVVASAEPEFKSQFKPMALAPADAEVPEPAKPARNFSLASLGGAMPWQRDTSGPAQVRAPIPPQMSASAQQKAPAYRQASVAGAPEYDDDHPDELSYVPFETARLMSDTSVAHDRELVPLTHPEQDDIGYLFDDMDQPARFELRRTSGYLGLASVQTLSGPAVRSLYAGLPKQGRTRLARAL
ncbi:DUF882 domain-containing protein [Methyloceanibacter sp.]|uniref:DUF882 domain-containing protein n=1 Tax=Methyloceanibacter sp. TaxID=1965321 RepID=UPI002C8F48A5|nr:DUF882 domain-containing protein [Methyloceanibacter sp.]HML93637.1 DUF882 domain-containing protein [Methyloceanibacter sp.]